jgi:hypothetical protein
MPVKEEWISGQYSGQLAGVWSIVRRHYRGIAAVAVGLASARHRRPVGPEEVLQVMRYPCLLLLTILGGCTYTYLSGADEKGGTVNLVTEFSQDRAIEMAKEHCREYNRMARVTVSDRQSNTLSFVCQQKYSYGLAIKTP